MRKTVNKKLFFHLKIILMFIIIYFTQLIYIQTKAILKIQKIYRLEKC